MCRTVPERGLAHRGRAVSLTVACVAGVIEADMFRNTLIDCLALEKVSSGWSACTEGILKDGYGRRNKREGEGEWREGRQTYLHR